MHLSLLAMTTLSAAFGHVKVAAFTTRTTSNDGVRAMIYTGEWTCDGCPDSIEDTLRRAYPNLNVTYADEADQITTETLNHVDVFAYGGGEYFNEAWDEAKSFAPSLRDFVHNGGRYLGFCLGAFLAGHQPGFGFIPDGDDTVREIEQDGRQVNDTRDTVIQVDWTFSTGSKKGTTDRKRWLYFQDGTAFDLADGSPGKVLGRYSSNGDVAAMLNSYGKGWVGNVGVHVEVDQSWYDDAKPPFKNPEGVKFDVGIDFVRSVIEAA